VLVSHYQGRDFNPQLVKNHFYYSIFIFVSRVYFKLKQVLISIKFLYEHVFKDSDDLDQI